MCPARRMLPSQAPLLPPEIGHLDGFARRCFRGQYRLGANVETGDQAEVDVNAKLDAGLAGVLTKCHTRAERQSVYLPLLLRQ